MDIGASLVVQWLRVRLPVEDMGSEDPTCCEVNKPTCHNYESTLQSPQAATTEPKRDNYNSLCSAREVTAVRSQSPATREAATHCRQRKSACSEDPQPPKINK